MADRARGREATTLLGVTILAASKDVLVSADLGSMVVYVGRYKVNTMIIEHRWTAAQRKNARDRD